MNHVFLSYRQESDAHRAAVRTLAQQLKDARLPVVLDQFFIEQNPGGPDEGWLRWCESHAEESACVLIVCSTGWFDSYRGRGLPGAGYGAAAEAEIFSQDIYDDRGYNSRIRLVVVDGFDRAQIPPRLRAWQIFAPFASPAEFDQMTAWIRQRLATPSAPATQAGKIVYISECKYDLRQERENLSAYLQEKGWQTLPADAGQAFPDNLQKSLAFTQLLESYPRDDGSHRAQLAQARATKKPCFRFRHAKIKLDEVEEEHRAFLSEQDVLLGSFDDFKANLLTELEAVWNQKHAPLPYASRELLVRVVIRGHQPDPLWDYVFAAVDAEPDMRAALLEGAENFKDKHDPSVPCHGFLIVCDSAAQDGGPLSPKPDLEHCMQIQLGEKNDARRPPVGLLYWPPPIAPLWPRLLRVNPPKMQRLVATTAAALQPFFAEVRRCAS